MCIKVLGPVVPCYDPQIIKREIYRRQDDILIELVAIIAIGRRRTRLLHLLCGCLPPLLLPCLSHPRPSPRGTDLLLPILLRRLPSSGPIPVPMRPYARKIRPSHSHRAGRSPDQRYVLLQRDIHAGYASTRQVSFMVMSLARQFHSGSCTHSVCLGFYHEPIDKIVGRCSWTTIDHDVHRMRRGAFSPYFSRAKVLELQPRISEKVELLRERMLTWEGSGELLNLYEAFSALTLGEVFGLRGCDSAEVTWSC